MAVDTRFTIVSQIPTVEFIGGTNTQNVIAVGVVTYAHNIYFETRITQADYSSVNARGAALSYTVIYETLAGFDHVADVTWGQRVNNSGLLIDTVTLEVSSDSGLSAGLLGPIDVVQLGPSAHEAEINALSAQLTAAEGAGGSS